jgi:NTP pyrophosphatase (non-canonical NTP hydrolase)
MTEEEERAIMVDALNLWGREAQIAMLVEEAAELIVAAQHLKRDSRPACSAMADFINELADVEIMVGQMRALGLGSRMDVAKESKLRRLRTRIAFARVKSDPPADGKE